MSAKEPRIGIHKVYTRAGDDGKTALVGGQRVPKDDERIHAYGAVDELNALVGLCIVEAGEVGVALPGLDSVQQTLFDLGSILATLPEDQHPDQPRPAQSDIDRLEAAMDEANKDLPALTSFVLPGGSRINALLHLARTVCRRAERHVVALWHDQGCTDLEVRYLNRLSDALFVWSRLAAKALGHHEVLWEPGRDGGTS